MGALTIDLDAQLENLRGLKSDLDEFYHSSGRGLSPHERDGVSIVIGQLTQRIIALEDVARRCESEEIRVEDLTTDETRTIDRALAVLDTEFFPDEGSPRATVWSNIRRLLLATDDLLLAAVRAVRGSAIGDAPPSGRGIVVAMSRRAR
jgi:hypothetical protein